jgi:hypothetical protein
MSIRKFRASRVNSTTANVYVGQPGDMFYDETTGQLKISDGHIQWLDTYNVIYGVFLGADII